MKCVLAISSRYTLCFVKHDFLEKNQKNFLTLACALFSAGYEMVGVGLVGVGWLLAIIKREATEPDVSVVFEHQRC